MQERSVEVAGHKQFDLRVTHIDPKTGKVIKLTPYVMTIDHRGTTFESPPGSGMIYNPKGELIHDGQKEQREKAVADAKADAEAKIQAKEAERQALLSQVEKEKAEIIAQARAEAEAIKADALRAKDEILALQEAGEDAPRVNPSETPQAARKRG